MTPPFSESQRVVTLPLFPPPSPLLISDKSLKTAHDTATKITQNDALIISNI